MKKIFLVAVSGLLIISTASAQQKATAVHTLQSFRILALFENGGHHLAFTDAARPWLDSLAVRYNFSIDYIHSTDTISNAVLSSYQLFLQLDYPPYGWTEQAQQAFIQYIEQGRGGWIGLHHASLLGNFDGYNMWSWFYDFMGSIQFKDYIPAFASAQVHIEDTSHPCVKGLPENFSIEKEEWYTYDKSPRSNVHVIASVDEKSYAPGSPVKMGDHPVIWTNDHYPARNIYIFMGHSPGLFQNEAFTLLFRNAILWASQK
ncbi:ThuA domain-containing protein [Agriterribacter sp.]|uniref:ThuA domain-containing protein n=1 Tax=Agriterribacter sp. TaxID=2821509 RepID=UPI002B663F14|nr:ThuA domain-containing protein [Agriterribacter sp.]HRO44446.1 ThuA domain-containing protein [Agriterribacter sp.]HRQ16527.1 ThuA domain-containing protein [Agriterribacter sp.]